MRVNKKRQHKKDLEDKEDALHVTVIFFPVTWFSFFPRISILLREDNPSFTDEHKRHVQIIEKKKKTMEK